MRNIWLAFKKLFGYKTIAVEVLQPVAPSPVTYPPVITSEGTPNITIGRTLGCTDGELDTIRTCSAYIGKVLKSDEFKQAVLAFKFDQDLTRGLSNQEIYTLYITTVMSFDLEIFNGSFSENHITYTEGYERDEDGYIRMNRHFLPNDGAAVYIMSLGFHELGHNPLNFTHPNLEQNSVPYGMNSIIESVSEKLGLKD